MWNRHWSVNIINIWRKVCSPIPNLYDQFYITCRLINSKLKKQRAREKKRKVCCYKIIYAVWLECLGYIRNRIKAFFGSFLCTTFYGRLLRKATFHKQIWLLNSIRIIISIISYNIVSQHYHISIFYEFQLSK